MTDASSPSPAARRPDRRPTSFWVAVILTGLLILSLAATVASMGALAALHPSEATFEEERLAGDRDAPDKIVDIAVTGTISDVDTPGSRSVVSTVIAQLRQAQDDAHVKGVLFEMNTPGGGITASDILYHEIDRFRKEKKVPVVVLCNDLTASGGYYAAMAADHVMAHQTSVVGSIGVIAQMVNVQGLMEKFGVQMNVVKSQRADGTESYKDIGSPFREMKPAERRMMQALIQRMWERFVDVVETGRSGKLTRKEVENLADGRVWTGGEALRLRLVDSLGYRDDAFRKVSDMAGGGKLALVRYRRPSNLLGGLLGVHAAPLDTSALLGAALDPAATSSPRLMYLWSVR